MENMVVFDFDGVIHSFFTPFQENGIIPDKPVEGIREEIQRIRKAGYKVIVVSARMSTVVGYNAIVQYLKDNNIEVDGVMREKPPAIAYIDDRAIRFNGKSEGLLENIQNLKVWNR